MGQKISLMVAALAARLTGTAKIEVTDSLGATVAAALAQLRTALFLGGTGYATDDVLLCPVVSSSGYQSASLTQNSASTLLFVPVVAGAVYQLTITLPGAAAGNMAFGYISCGVSGSTCHLDSITLVGAITAVTVANNGTLQVTQSAATQSGTGALLRLQ